jgi:hypothetical protein
MGGFRQSTENGGSEKTQALTSTSESRDMKKTTLKTKTKGEEDIESEEWRNITSFFLLLLSLYY